MLATVKKLFLVLFSLIFVYNISYAQSQKEIIQSALKEIVKEKTHLKSAIKSDAIKSALQNIELRSSQENKITNNDKISVSEGEPMITVDVNNPNYMSIGFMRSSDLGLEMPIYYSEDAGVSWKLSSFNIQDVINTNEETRGGALLGGGDPVLIYDNNNKLYYSWISFTAKSSNLKIITWYAVSDDHGKTFRVNKEQPFLALGKFKNIQSGVLENYGNGIFDRQWLAIDRSNGPNRGTIYCSGLHLPRTDANKLAGIGLTKMTPSNQIFDENIKIINGSNFVQFANIVVDKQGNLHVVYASTNNKGIFHQVSKDGGNSFSAIHKIANNRYEMQGTKIIQSRENPMPMIVMDETNNEIFVSWTDYANNEVQAYYSSSKDGGKTWEVPRSIGDFRALNEQSFMPALSTNKKGDVSFSWFQVDDKNKSHFYTAVKEKNQTSSHNPINITTKETRFLPYINRENVFFGDYLNAVMIGCKTYAVFSDGRDNKGAKLYIGITDYCDEISSIQRLSSEFRDFDIKSIYPQPANEKISVVIESKNNLEIMASWYDVKGQILQKGIKIKINEESKEINLQIPETVQSGQILYLELRANDQRIVKKVSKL